MLSKSKLIVLIIILSALSFNHAFNFHLFWDDWYQILGALYYPEISKGYLSMHPVSVLEFKLLSNIFKFNPYFWQFLGYLLKVIDSISMWPLILALTNSKKAALYSCLIFAVFGVGMESFFWASAHSSAIVIPLINLGLYFWIKSTNHKSIKLFLIGLFLFTLSILAEPGRAFMVIVLVSIWEFLSLYQKFSFKNIAYSLFRIVFLLLLIPSTSLIISNFYSITPDFSIILRGFSEVNIHNLIDSLKNLLFGWVLIPEQFRQPLTIVFLLAITLVGILFIWKKLDAYKIILFLFLWQLLFYTTNYLAQHDARSGGLMEWRYYTISSVGLAGLLAYGFSFIKSKYTNWIIFLFLLFNVYVTNQILIQYATFRSISVHNKIWNKIDNDVPKGEKISVFMYSGEDFSQRARLLDWNDSIPFAINRGIVKKEEYPIMTSDKNLIAKLVCEKNVLRHSPFGDLVQKESIPLSHIHAWELKKGELEERSETERDGIKRIAKCLNRT